MIGWTFVVKQNGETGRGSAWLPPSIRAFWGHAAGSCQERRGVSCDINARLRPDRAISPSPLLPSAPGDGNDASSFPDHTLFVRVT